MERPQFKDFVPDSITVADIQKAFTDHPQIYQYIVYLDKYIDWLESGKKDENETLPCQLMRDGETYDCRVCGKSFIDHDTSLGCPHVEKNSPICIKKGLYSQKNQ